MKKLMTMLLLLLTAAVPTGCSDDDDNATADPTQLIGKWECYKSYDGEYDDWDEEYGADTGFMLIVEYNADATGSVSKTESYDGKTYSETRRFTYSLSGNTITMVDEDDEPYSYRIEKLSADELIFAIDYRGENGQSCTDKEYYKRIG